jgi:L-ascorbate metabolism protein UlaG (beta-lactamase superfamily)
MYITWLGHSSFKLQDKISSDGITLVTDPFDDKLGIKMPKIEADIVTISHDHEDHNNKSAIKGNPFVIHCAGEYEVKNVAIEGVEVPHDDKDGKERGKVIAYRIDMDDISIAHLSDLGGPLNPKQLETLGNVDVLLVPVGGKFTLDAKKAVEVVSQIEPRIVIPMHYAVPGLKLDLDPVEKFIKELGVKPRMEDKLKVIKKDLPTEDMELVILNF